MFEMMREVAWDQCWWIDECDWGEKLSRDESIALERSFDSGLVHTGGDATVGTALGQ